jgi:hypothetical protein
MAKFPTGTFNANKQKSKPEEKRRQTQEAPKKRNKGIKE